MGERAANNERKSGIRGFENLRTKYGAHCNWCKDEPRTKGQIRRTTGNWQPANDRRTATGSGLGSDSKIRYPKSNPVMESSNLTLSPILKGLKSEQLAANQRRQQAAKSHVR
ncbi:hypothetical protein ACSBR2_032446 [Camellia fascicularis]